MSYLRKMGLPALALAALAAAGQAAEVAVIANASVEASQVSANDLREVFSGNQSSLTDGTKVTPALLKSGAAHDAFLKTYVGKTDGALTATWRKLVFTGKGALPKTFDSESAMANFVAATKGAVGYVSASAVPAGVKVLAVK